MTKLAVVGGTGLVGSHILDEGLEREMEILGTFLDRDPGEDHFERMDINRMDDVHDVLGAFEPDVVIQTAAVSDVDHCERNPQMAWEVNVEGILNMAMVCSDLGCPLMFVSSDYVFNGMKGSPYFEGDVVDPINIYGRTKVEGERIVLDASRDNSIARVSVVYGWRGRSERDNIVLKILRHLREGKELGLYHDQFNCPTYAPLSASMMIDLAMGKSGTLSLFEGPEARIHHVCGRECVSRLQLGRAVAEVFDLDPGHLRSISIDDMGPEAPRPGRICLDVESVEAELNISIPSLRETLEDMRSKEEER
jgi:dTDP-4-dehydrorhamnose reductase